MKNQIKKTIITAGLEFIALSGAAHLLKGASGRGMIFTLHHVRPASNQSFQPNALLAITPEFLDDAIVECLKKGYEPIAISDLPDAIEHGPENKRYVAFTLDDGCKDNAIYAAPVFRKHNVPFTLYITKGLVERTHTMWWETAEAFTRASGNFSFNFGTGSEEVQCETISQKHAAFLRLARFIEAIEEDSAVARINDAAAFAGVDPLAIVSEEIMDADALAKLAKDPLAQFGVHTTTHCNLARVDEARLEREIYDPIDAVADWTGRAPKTIAYPYGWKRACGEREGKMMAAAGLIAGVTTQPGVINNFGCNNWKLMPRVSLNGLYQKKRYVSSLLSGIPFRVIGG